MYTDCSINSIWFRSSGFDILLHAKCEIQQLYVYKYLAVTQILLTTKLILLKQKQTNTYLFQYTLRGMHTLYRNSFGFTFQTDK